MLCDGDFAHEQAIEVGSEEFLVGMVAAMADAGARGPRNPVWRADNQVLVEFDVQFIARRSEHEQCSAYCRVSRGTPLTADALNGDTADATEPLGMAYFVTPGELKTPAGVDVRELETAEQWCLAQSRLNNQASGYRALANHCRHVWQSEDHSTTGSWAQ